MKNLVLFSMFSIVSLNSYAEFQVRFPIAEKQNIGLNPFDPNWETVDFGYGVKEKVGNPYNCQNWSPSVSQVSSGTSFTQNGTSCSQRYETPVIMIQVNKNTGEPRYLLQKPMVEIDTTATDKRSMVGSQQGWKLAEPIYGAWGRVFEGEGETPYYTYTNREYPYNCVNPQPAPDTQPYGIWYTATSDCKHLEGRTVQKREQNTATNEYRNFEEQEWEIREGDYKYTSNYNEGTIPWTSGCRAFGFGGVDYRRNYLWYKMRESTYTDKYGYYGSYISDDYYQYPNNLNQLNFTGGGNIEFNNAKKVVYMEDGKEQIEINGWIYYPGNKVKSAILVDQYEICIKKANLN